MDEDQTSNISLISCMHFVKQGVAQAIPEKIQLSQQEMDHIIQQTAAELRISTEGDDEDNSDEETPASAPTLPPTNPDDEFDLENYDDAQEDTTLAIGNIACIANSGDLSENVHINTEDSDSDAENEIIKPDDNLLLVGHVESDASTLEVYIINHEEGSMYVHHDMLLPWFPLCIEWLSYDPSYPQPGNLCAIGGMDPVIQVWDLDIINCLEPAFKLGQKPSKKKKLKRIGHKDAVMDLAWNKNYGHVLGSASVDQTVLLWDLDQGLPHTTISCFNEKVQSLAWHAHEAQTLCAGCAGGWARVFDCRTIEAGHRAWQVSGEVENITWDPLNPFCFAASTNNGRVVYIDCRNDQPLWSLDAHPSEVNGLILSDKCPGLMITLGNDGKMKTWDTLNCNGPNVLPQQVTETTLNIGQALCLAGCPENPFLVTAGGDNKASNLKLQDLTVNDEVNARFGTRELVTMAVDSQMEAA